ncbi:MAG: Lrp/AsnC family transcriptional regulator [Nitrososphaerota archaeon]|nr:Lrp/AsnC family transcriptional regulator [Nitrososphaerota archaeon]MDG6979048.1 Lrp/AsnC family transcriptional regulator [Nitrososphaerota archaeon]MDG6981398.1 Lrp/AsnC family transcriptional regulator [Nitrososphaerota archaeon]
MRLDETDGLILKALRDDARLPFVEIAGRVGLSEAAVRRRVANLVQAGTIKKFTVVVEEDKESTSAITYVSVSPSHPTSEVSKKLESIPGVESIYETTGSYDIAAIIKGANIEEVNRSVEEIRRIGGVLKTETTIILRTIR